MKEFKSVLFDRLIEICNKVPIIKILYKHSLLTGSHLLKVLPEKTYENSEIYKELEAELIFDFIDSYPDESLVFMTDGDWNDFSDADKEFVSNEYELISRLENNTSGYEFKSTVIVENEIINDCIESIDLLDLDTIDNELVPGKTSVYSKILSEFTNIKGKVSNEESGEFNYSLAA